MWTLSQSGGTIDEAAGGDTEEMNWAIHGWKSESHQMEIEVRNLNLHSGYLHPVWINL